MPPRVRIIALICLWACPAWTAAQTLPASGPFPSPYASPSATAPQAASGRSAGPSLDESRSRVGGVLPAAFAQPIADTPSPARSPDRRVTAPSPTRPDEPKQSASTPQFHLPLPPPGSSESALGSQTAKPRGGGATTATVVGSLAVVLGLFFVLAWAMRRASPRGSLNLPTEVVEILGRAPLAARQQVHLLRCGTKLLLVSVTPTGAETLTEITDPDEVTRLAGLCRQARPDSATATFRDVFGQLSGEGSMLGFLGGNRGKEDALEGGRDA